MLNGIYRCKEDGLSWYDYTVEVKETKKTYTMKLLKSEARFAPLHIDTMFGDKEKVVINKEKSAHGIIDWQDGSFTIYPFRDGIPYLFELQKEK